MSGVRGAWNVRCRAVFQGDNGLFRVGGYGARFPTVSEIARAALAPTARFLTGTDGECGAVLPRSTP